MPDRAPAPRQGIFLEISLSQPAGHISQNISRNLAPPQELLQRDGAESDDEGEEPEAEEEGDDDDDSDDDDEF